MQATSLHQNTKERIQTCKSFIESNFHNSEKYEKLKTDEQTYQDNWKKLNQKLDNMNLNNT